MKIVTHTEAAPGDRENEDFIVMADNLVGVLDGVSTPAKLDTGCTHDPAWYVRQLANRLAEAAQDEPNGSLQDYLASAIRSVNKAHEHTCDLTNPHTPASTVSLLRQRGPNLDYLLLCDSPILIKTVAGEVTVLLDERLDTALEEARRSLLAGDVAIDSPEHAQRLHQLILHKQQLTNQANGYWIASSNSEAAYQAHVGTLPLVGGSAVEVAALLTDGASRAVDTFDMFTWAGLLDLMAERGPADLIAMVRTSELQDLQGKSRPRYKRHDDATAVLCTFDLEEL